MGGRPLHALVTVAGPPDTDVDLLYRGRRRGREGLSTARSSAATWPTPRSLVVTVAVTGTVDGDPVLRRGARPGDGIYLTGPVGLSAAGLRQLRARRDRGHRGGVGPPAPVARRRRRPGGQGRREPRR